MRVNRFNGDVTIAVNKLRNDKVKVMIRFDDNCHCKVNVTIYDPLMTHMIPIYSNLIAVNEDACAGLEHAVSFFTTSSVLVVELA